MEFLIILLVVVAVVAIVALPLRGGRAEEAERREVAELAELEIEKESKYREIRDAEMDYRTGKLSREDWRALDRTLRAEAIQLLRRIDVVKPAAEAARARRPGAAAGDASPDADGSAEPAPRRDAPVG